MICSAVCGGDVEKAGWQAPGAERPMAKRHLRDVTLLTVTSIQVEEAQATLVHCCRELSFGAVKLLSSSPPRPPAEGIQHVPIPAIDLPGYSAFMLRDLKNYVETPYCLVVQTDGFVLNPSNWQDAFLEYDYIGAPWPSVVKTRDGGSIEMTRNRVGNGGFSLRSTRLLEATARLVAQDPSCPLHPEDLAISLHLFDRLSAAGHSFAPIGLAAQFAIESPLPFSKPIDKVFGFHGKLHLPAVNRLLAHRASGP